ncbi:molybdopterin cofactor-binding domain-containing protein [Embleya scabrispora]|uniref:molybdopterin cofactor-binding domain-containing protein n=1 Tax=Embleya scabrispora TaxID=159449 RepID=UPI0003A412EC|nr:molybdopterin cofactor-binding domain-containing protein [Embleya scabrispora]MYS80749.1 molybdopterin-dependent oxidoreductase [Streptomyces sp. SID5474]
MIGHPVPPVDWQARTGGSAIYAGDLALPGMLIGGVLRSPHPHARITSIDVSAAVALSGVACVLTADDLPDRRYLDYGGPYADRYPLARDVVRHVGEPVAIVAAQTREQVDRALALIKVGYRRLRAAPTVADALASGAPSIHPGGNLASETRQSHGDITAGRRAAVHVVKGRYVSPKQAHAIMEPHTVVAHWTGERLEMWAPSQGPRAIHADLAQVLGLDPEQVHLNEVAVGGDFGSRVDISHLESLAAFLSMKTGRPVRLGHDREDEFAFTKSRQSWDMELEFGADADGAVTHLAADFVSDNGAYNMAGPSEIYYGASALGSAYRVRGYAAHGRCVYTNKQPPSSFRGAGGYPPNFGLEIIADELADAVGMDPIDFRIKNAVGAPGETAVTGWHVKSSRLVDCLATVRREIDWDAKRALGGSGRGVGVAATIHVTGLRREGMVESGAAVDILRDGRIRLRTGAGDPGTGQKTMLAQVVAHELRVGLDRIDLVTTDTERTPHDTGAGASRGTFVSAHAVGKAARTAAEALRDLAAAKFACDPGDVTLADGQVTGPGGSLPIGELVDVLEGELRVETEYIGDFEDDDGTGAGDISATYSFAAHAVEVDVDRTTGAVKVVKVVAAHDSGRILNPLTARGQVEGGVVIGVGAVLGEELIFEGGRVVNAGYADYAMPRAADIPEISVHFLGADDPEGPYGAKGLAEITLLPTGAAVVNAVSHALGTRVRETPMTPDRILKALGRSTPVRPLWRRPNRWWVGAIRWAYPKGLHAVLSRLGARWGRAPRTGSIDAVHQPTTVAEAATLLAGNKQAKVIAGGTDLLVARKQQLVAPEILVDLTGCSGLARVSDDEDGGLHVGAAVTLAELEAAGTVGAALRDTARQIASTQIRSMATVAGNLLQDKRCWFYRHGFDCYKRSGPASPCYAVLGDHRFYHSVIDGHRCQAVTPSDLATTFTALDAVVRTQIRDLPIADLYKGPGETVIDRDEIVTAVLVPAAARQRTTVFAKSRLWDGGFATVSAAVSIAADRSQCRVVLGGVAPVPYRAHEVERLVLAGAVPEHAAGAWTRDAHPLRDNAWKLDAGTGLLTRLLEEACA